MNDEYLWQKTGEDPEIAKLEETLAVFRYREDAAPALTITQPAKPGRWRLLVGLAVPAFAAVAIAGGMWIRKDESEITFIHQPPAEVLQKPVEPAAPAVQPTSAPKQPVDRRTRGAQSASLVVPRRARAKTHPRRSETVALTKEERYAYRQLMLALSISGSQLNIVRNTINGVEDEPSELKKNDR
jgi:hypothetical protein